MPYLLLIASFLAAEAALSPIGRGAPIESTGFERGPRGVVRLPAVDVDRAREEGRSPRWESAELTPPRWRDQGPELVPPVVEDPAPMRRLPALVEEEPTALSGEISAAPLEAGTAPPQAPQSERSLAPPSGPAMQAVAQRADELTRRGFSLAQRGALYSARAEFISALRVLTQALDVQSAQAAHGKALADGLRALRESDDFVPSGSRLEADLDMAPIVAAHRTPVLKESDERAAPLAALQQYYTFAKQQLARAGGGQPAAARALYGLGKVQMALAAESGALEQKMHGPKAMSFFQAALLVDPRNTLAANELGVLLARYGQWRDARQVFLQGVASGPRAETWHNLAVAHQHLGEMELSRRAQWEADQATQGGAGPAAPERSASAIHWVRPEQFPRALPSWRPGPTNDAAAPEAERTSSRRPFWGSSPW